MVSDRINKLLEDYSETEIFRLRHNGYLNWYPYLGDFRCWDNTDIVIVFSSILNL